MSERPANRLIRATSPYLLQHAHNPVDWYEWGEEPLERARREDKPILLSVGYAACHWCHVMERESFEDRDTARLMNKSFVCVKVDREERPDIDAVYMDAVQAMSGQGGWPMTVFLTPEGEPFFAGTYFPPEDRHGLPAFKRVLTAVAQAWRGRREELLSQGRKVVEAIARTAGLPESEEPLSEEVLRTARGTLSAAFDPRWGGLGPPPKFPQPMALEFLLLCALRGDSRSLEVVGATLDRMAAGGIQDQVGGGFHRYSTDERWLVPHFEKMLYDNAQLARLYLHTWQLTGEERNREVTTRTLDYLLREMRHPDGGFFSSQDADSQGVEGKFYVWGWDELVDVAGEDVARWYGAGPEGNWDGTNVLWTPRAPDGGSPPAGVDDARRRLFDVREGRDRPATDDKVLAAWNGLTIQALAEAGTALGRPEYVEAAGEAARFLLSALRRGDGRLLRAWREGRVSGPAYADDYAAMGLACLALHEATFELAWAEEARGLADDLIRLFHDQQGGGFFQTGSDTPGLLIRPKDLFDNAVPSGNSMAAELLLRLGRLTGEPAYERAGLSALRVARGLMARAPSAFGHALSVLNLHLSPGKEVAIVGDPRGDDTRRLAEEVWRRYLPTAVLAVGRPGDEAAARVLPLLADRPGMDGGAAAYVCERFVCRRPVGEPAELGSELDR